MFIAIAAKKTMFESSFPPFVCGRVHVLLVLFVWIFVLGGVQGILCCGFVCFSSSCVPYVASFSVLCFVCLRLVYPVLPVSLDYPIVIALSVFSNVYMYNGIILRIIF